MAMRTISRPKIIGVISPPPYAQSSPPKPDVEGAQSPPAAHRDDSLATNPSGGLITEDHPPKRRRGGSGRAGVFAVAACLAWLAWPTAAVAQGIGVYSIASNDVVDASEKWAGFTITGGTGTESGVTVTVNVNGTQVGTATSDASGNWVVNVEGDASFVTTAVSGQYAEATRGTPGSLDFLSHQRSFTPNLKLPLVVNAVTGDDIVNNGTFDIKGNTGTIGLVPVRLNLGGLILTTTSEQGDGTWVRIVQESDTDYSHELSVSLSVTATKTGYTDSDAVSRTLTVDMEAPTVSYTAPSSLKVGVEIDPLSPTTSDTDIASYVASSLLTGLRIDQSTGDISGTPTTVNSSKQTSKVTVTDDGGNTAEENIEFPEVVAATLTVALDAIAGDDYLNASEFSGGGLDITGNTGTTSGASVTVTITGVDPGGNATPQGTLTATSNASGDWVATVPGSAAYIVANAVLTVSVTATKTNYTDAPSVSRTLTVDLTAPTVSYTAPSNLEVDVAITAIDPSTNDTDIVSYAISSSSLPRGLSLNGGTGVISGTPTTGDLNTQRVAVLATDDAGNTGTAMIDFPPVVGPEPGVTVFPQPSLEVPEGRSAGYTVVLNTQPTHDVTINVGWVSGSGSDTDLTPNPTTLTFALANWNAEQTVTVSAAEDADGRVGIRNFSHTVSSTDSIYDDIGAPALRVAEADNDTIGVTIWPQVLRMPDGGSRKYKVVLNTQPTDDVTITVTRDQGGDDDLTVAPGTLIFTEATWYTPQTVTVSAAEDDDQVNGVAIFSHSVSSNDENYQSDDEITIASVRVTEDETRPRVEIQTEASATVGGPFEVAIRFSEEVTGFEQSEITVTNGSVTGFSGSKRSYTAEITPSASGQVRVEVAEDVAEDEAGNPNRAAEPLVIEADVGRPEVTIEGPTEPVGMEGFEVTIAFSEPVAGFEQDDIQVTNGTVADFTEVSASEYQAMIEPTQAGQPVVVEVPENVARDAAGNGNLPAEFRVDTKLLASYEAERYTAIEGDAAVTVTVKLSPAGAAEELTIPIQVTRLETTEADDYTVGGLEAWDAEEGTGKLTVSEGETTASFTIEANYDADGEDEKLELGFGELPTAVMPGDPAVATVTLEDKMVELTVSFGQAEYEIREGQEADIEVEVSPAADRRVEAPLVVALQGGATDEDYSGVPATVVFEEGESQGTIAIKVLADEVNDPGEGMVLSFGELPLGVISGDPSSTQVHFTQQRTAEQFSQTLEVMLAVLARSTAASVQSAIQGRFERHRQWSRLASSGGVQGPGTNAAASADAAEPTQGSRLRSFSLGSLGSVARSGLSHLSAAPSYGTDLRGSVYGQDRLYGSGIGDAPLGPGSTDLSGTRDQGFSLAGTSFEMALGKQEQGTSTSWVPVLWGQGDLQHFNGDLDRLEMKYRGRLEAAHVGLDLYANDQVLAGLSFMRSWGDMDYTDDGVDGVLGSDLNTFHPYLYWEPNERVSMWGFGGMGWGEVDVEEPGRTHDFDADFRMLAGGVRSVLCRWPCNELALRADAFTAQLRTDATDDIAKVSGEAHRGRLMLEWVHDLPLAAGRSLSLQLEAGGRFDGGDADRGAGVETGFRLRYLDANCCLDVALHGRTLVVHESDYRDWGLGVQASWDPGEKQRGFRASVMSTWGQDGGGRTTLWDNADAVMLPAGLGAMGMSAQYRMESEMAYAGMTAPGVPGLLKPYARLRWAGPGRELALGTAWSLPNPWQLALPLTFEVEGLRRESGTGPADLAVSLRTSLPF